MNKFITKADSDRGLVAVECVTATIQKTVTGDGLGKLKGLQVGQTVIVTIRSLRKATLTTKEGKKHDKLIYNLIDESGKGLGWIYAECIFPDMVIL
jgi:hypothetical protein